MRKYGVVKSREIRESKDVLASVVGLRLNIFTVKLMAHFLQNRLVDFLHKIYTDFNK